jgi:hypothetical protein
MWVRPRPLERGSYVTLKADNFFELLHKEKTGFFSFLNQKEYFITIKDEQRTMIANTASKEEIESTWKWITENISKSLSSDENERQDMLQFLHTKFTLLAESQEEQTKEEDERKRQRQFFHEQFNLGPEEELVTYYMCALKRGIVRRPGWMYLSKKYLCFSSKVMKEKIVLSFREINSIEKYDAAVALANGIIIKTKDKEFDFTLFYQRNETYEVLLQLWNLAMETLLRQAESLGENNEESKNYQQTNNGNNNNVSAERHFGKMAESEAVNQTSSQKSDLNKLSGEKTVKLTFKDVDFQKTNKKFQSLFRFPEKEILKQKSDAQLKMKNSIWRGWLFIFSNFLCFLSDRRPVVQITIPFKVIISLEMVKSEENNELRNTIKLVSATQEFLIFVSPQNEPQIYSTMYTQWRIATFRPFSYVGFLETSSENRIVELRRLEPLPEDYEVNEEKNATLWETFFLNYGYGLCRVNNKEFRSLVRRGVPDKLRGLIWQVCSGSVYLRLVKEQEGYYQRLLEIAKGKSTIEIEEIEKDLHRTFPEHPFFQTSEGINSLRNVLVAYAFHNPEVGYCQSMNVIAGLLLLFMNEESAFYLLMAICEILMPQYYSKVMLGSIVHQTLFENLIAEKLPQLYNHFTKLSVPIAPITMPWFLLLFIGILPFTVTLRVLDCFFLVGPKILFKTGLAILKLNQEKLLLERDGASVACFLKEKFSVNTSDLLHTIFEDFRDLQMAKLQEKRNAHKFQAILNIEQSNKLSKINLLREKTNLTKEKLEKMYHQFKTLLLEEEVIALNCDQFANLLYLYFPNWQNIHSQLHVLVWKYLNKGPQDTIDFDEIILGLAPLCKEELVEQYHVVVSIVTTSNGRTLSFDELVLVLKLLLKLYIKETVMDLDVFAKMIFDKLETPFSERVSVEKVKEEVIIKPLFVEFFGIKTPTSEKSVTLPKRRDSSGEKVERRTAQTSSDKFPTLIEQPSNFNNSLSFTAQ